MLECEGSEYTEYPDFTVEYREASHRYWLLKGEERRSIPSVTGILKVLSKPSLIGWAEKCGAEGALRMERDGRLQGYSPKESIWAIRAHHEGADAKRNAGGERGLALHHAQEVYCELGDVPNLGDFDPEVRGYVQGYCKWLLRDGPEPIFTERVVASARTSYGGRVDMLAKVKGRIVLPDLKTSARPYPEQHLQIAGYMGALTECYPEIELSEGLIVLVRADGSFETYPCMAALSDFLAVLDAHGAMFHVNAAMHTHQREAEIA